MLSANAFRDLTALYVPCPLAVPRLAVCPIIVFIVPRFRMRTLEYVDVVFN